MGSDEFFERIARGGRWKDFLGRVGVKIGWVAPLLHWGTAIVVGILVASDFPAVAATVGVLYRASCIYDAQEHVLRALFEIQERQEGRVIPEDEEEETT